MLFRSKRPSTCQILTAGLDATERGEKKKQKEVSAVDVNAAPAGGAHHVSGSQRSLLPRTSLFVLVFPCAAAYLPSLLNCLANISARERQISLFPVDIVLSELAVAALII